MLGLPAGCEGQSSGVVGVTWCLLGPGVSQSITPPTPSQKAFLYLSALPPGWSPGAWPPAPSQLAFPFCLSTETLHPNPALESHPVGLHSTMPIPASHHQPPHPAPCLFLSPRLLCLYFFPIWISAHPSTGLPAQETLAL